jgi:peptidoglycan/xylan/chitin deacetylase (PgdA/CDA1 family)
LIKNFLFHRVNPQRDKLWDPMDVALFEKSISYISNTHDVVLLEDLVGKNAKGKFATIMFDDGYKDNLEYAAPILEKYKCKASFYVVTDCIDRNEVTWTHFLDHAFQNTKKNELTLGLGFIPGELKRCSNETRIEFAAKLKPFLKKISHAQRIQVLNVIKETFSDIDPPKLMMNWKEVAQLKNAGHYIGSHSVSHAMLGTMENELDVRNELINSGTKIKDQLGYFPKTISYPVGSFNDQTKQLAKENGYEIGLAVKQTPYDPNTFDNFEIPRIELYNESWWKTRSRITNSLEKFKSLIGYK